MIFDILIDTGDAAHAVTDDFNGLQRGDGMPDVGAYERERDEPGSSVWLAGLVLIAMRRRRR